ncbi:hypothetical protein [Photobacterium angustum]|uniref:hypothetical protein n=1 Tax=Photobacterium angustum TaxID=661 RepID=UPI001364CFE1|nr:hypothetical protein [Photobacterium angustum]
MPNKSFKPTNNAWHFLPWVGFGVAVHIAAWSLRGSHLNWALASRKGTCIHERTLL